MNQKKTESLVFSDNEKQLLEKYHPRVALVIAEFHREVSDELTKGAEALLASVGLEHDKFILMGALEIPLAIARLDNGYDIYVALGAVVRGETSHYDIVAYQSARGLMELGLKNKKAIGNGILTVDTSEQAMVRADHQGQNKGGFASLAAIRLWLIDKK